MTCADCVKSLGALVDGELPAGEVARMEEHVANCADCAAAHHRLVDTSSRLKGALMRYKAPDVLKARIRATLTEPERVVAPRPPALPATAGRGWIRNVAAAAVIAIVSSGLTFVAMRDRPSDRSVQSQVLASHIRSLMPGHLTDVASNDQHNVKPWFNGRVNLSPEVPRLDSVGFPLVGGRVDYIDGHNVASVAYTRRQHVINVFVWPAHDATNAAASESSENGYNLIHARRGGEEYWVVSDLNFAELRAFAAMVIPRSQRAR
jgi:anti-sigma factor RsiW